VENFQLVVGNTHEVVFLVVGNGIGVTDIALLIGVIIESIDFGVETVFLLVFKFQMTKTRDQLIERGGTLSALSIH